MKRYSKIIGIKTLSLVIFCAQNTIMHAEILPSRKADQRYLSLRLSLGDSELQKSEDISYVKPSVTIEKSPITRNQFKDFMHELQNNFNQLREKVSKKEQHWSIDITEQASQYLACHNYSGLRMLLKQVDNADLYKQEWVCRLGQKSLHPLLLFEWSNMLINRNPLEALSYYLLGCRRLAEDVKRVYGKENQELIVLKKLMHDFTSKYGAVFTQEKFSEHEREYAVGRMKELYRHWKKDNGKDTCDINLVFPRWIAAYDRGLPEVDAIPEFSYPISHDHKLGNGIVSFLRNGPLDQLFGLEEPIFLIERLTK